MDVTIPRVDLLRELSLMEKCISRKPTIPELASVLFHANGAGLFCSATDLEIAIRTPCKVTVSKDGTMIVPARTLLEMVRSLPDDASVRLVADSKSVGVTAGSFRARLQAHPTENFPTLAVAEGSGTTIPALLFRELILRTHFATSSTDKRYHLDGANLEIGEESFTCVATDGHRLAVATAPRPKGQAVPSILLPKRTLETLIAVLDDADGDVEYVRAENHLFFSVADRIFTSRTVDGAFPAWQRIVPKGHTIRVELPRLAFLDTLRRTLLVADSEQLRVTFSLEPSKLLVAARSAEVGDADESLDVTYDGPPATVSVNGRYVVDFLEAAATDKVLMQMSDERHPIELQSMDSDVTYKYVVMPQVI